MTVVLAHATTVEGRAAQDTAVEEARRRGEGLLQAAVPVIAVKPAHS